MKASQQQQQQDPSTDTIQSSISLLNDVYGPIDGPKFPLPMPADEAGKSTNGQRRYLWTDAFGVLAYTSIAEKYGQNGNSVEAEKYRRAANTLIDVVHESLGKPRSDKSVDEMQKIDSDDDDRFLTPTGYVGLRIGKVSTKKVTDYGMSYDGQYWHYIDKWLLALQRAGRIDDGIRIAKSSFPYFFDEVGGGIRWKLSVDSTSPPSLERAYPSEDTLVALIVFSLLESSRKSSLSNNDNNEKNIPSLADEIEKLQTSLKFYKPRVTDDPLGWGLEALFDQFIQGQPRQRTLASLHGNVLHAYHLSLPFRLYGAMIGAKVVGDSIAPPSLVNTLIRKSLDHENKISNMGINEQHSCINRVMLAMCILCPGALRKRPSDPIISI